MKQRKPVFDSALIGVYKITSPSYRVYIGMTCDSFNGRWTGHQKDLRTGRHSCIGLLRAASKYGIESLQFEVLESWTKPSTLEELLILEKVIQKREQYWWDFYAEEIKPYNSRPSGAGSVIHNEETREKLRRAVSKNFLERNENGFYSRGTPYLAGHCANKKCSNFMRVRRERANNSYCSATCLPEKASYYEAISKELLENLHLNENLHWDEIGRRYGVSGSAIYYWLKKYEIPLQYKRS